VPSAKTRKGKKKRLEVLLHRSHREATTGRATIVWRATALEHSFDKATLDETRHPSASLSRDWKGKDGMVGWGKKGKRRPQHAASSMAHSGQVEARLKPQVVAARAYQSSTRCRRAGRAQLQQDKRPAIAVALLGPIGVSHAQALGRAAPCSTTGHSGSHDGCKGCVQSSTCGVLRPGAATSRPPRYQNGSPAFP
jgi:hypothetical protein